MQDRISGRKWRMQETLFIFFLSQGFFATVRTGVVRGQHRMLRRRRQQGSTFHDFGGHYSSWWNCQCKTLFQFYYLFVAIIFCFKNAAHIKLQWTANQQCLKITQKVSFHKSQHLDDFFKWNRNMKSIRQFDLVLHNLAYECCSLTNFSS